MKATIRVLAAQVDSSYTCIEELDNVEDPIIPPVGAKYVGDQGVLWTVKDHQYHYSPIPKDKGGGSRVEISIIIA